MRFSNLGLLVALGATLSSALPSELTNFLLVTTDQAEPTSDSSQLKAVSATSLFDPYYQPNILLRLTGPGYGSLPNFTLTSGTLHTWAAGPHGIGYYEYNSTSVKAGEKLQFLAEEQGSGNLALSDGYLLTVGGEKEGWTICKAELEEQVLFWKGTATDCKKTYVHAVTGAPY